MCALDAFVFFGRSHAYQHTHTHAYLAQIICVTHPHSDSKVCSLFTGVFVIMRATAHQHYEISDHEYMQMYADEFAQSSSSHDRSVRAHIRTHHNNIRNVFARVPPPPQTPQTHVFSKWILSIWGCHTTHSQMQSLGPLTFSFPH